MEDVVSKVKPIEDNEASTSRRPFTSDQMKELLSGSRTKGTDQLVILEGRQVRISGIPKGFCVRPQLEHKSPEDSITNLEEERHTSDLQCSICQEHLSSDEALLEHMQMHTGKRYRCKDCPALFISLEQLHCHRFSTHYIKRTKLECPVCQKMLSSKQNLREHMRLHTGERSFSCDQCDMSFMAKDRLLRHQKHVHLGQRPPPSKCPICHKEISCKKAFKNHILGHNEGNPDSLSRPRPFVCEECGGSFTLKQTLMTHMRIHTGVLPFPCDRCGHRCRTSSHLLRHKKAKHRERVTKTGEGVALTTEQNIIYTGKCPYCCTECDEKFISSEQLIAHYQQKHFSAEEPPVRFVPCTICEKKVTQQGLDEHMQTHTGERPYFCKECNLYFTSNDCLCRHLKSPCHLEKCMLSCSFCPEKFTSKQELMEHLKTHSVPAIFTCSECGKVLKTKSALGRHMRVHTGERPHICDVCENGFSNRLALKEHRMMHAEKRTFVCDKCGHGFAAKLDLNHHLRRVHSNFIWKARVEANSVVLEASEVSAEDGASGETTQDSDSESDLKHSQAPFDILNECITNNDQKPTHPVGSEKRRYSEFTSRVPDLNVLEKPLPEVKQEETDRLTLVGDSDYGEEGWSSGVVEPTTSRWSAVKHRKNRKRKLPLDLGEKEEFGIESQMTTTNSLQEAIPGPTVEATDGLLMLEEPDGSGYDEERWTSGASKLSSKRRTSMRMRKRKRPFDYDDTGSSAIRGVLKGASEDVDESSF